MTALNSCRSAHICPLQHTTLAALAFKFQGQVPPLGQRPDSIGQGRGIWCLQDEPKGFADQGLVPTEWCPPSICLDQFLDQQQAAARKMGESAAAFSICISILGPVAAASCGQANALLQHPFGVARELESAALLIFQLRWSEELPREAQYRAGKLAVIAL